MHKFIPRAIRGGNDTERSASGPGSSSGVSGEHRGDDVEDMIVLHHEEPLPAPEESPADSVRRVLSGEEVVVSHIGASQYANPSGGGVSACGLAALNCLRVVFTREKAGVRGEALLEELMTREVAEEITAICSQWSSNSHLEVEEIFKVPLFDQSLRRLDARFSQPSLEEFQNILSILQSGEASDTSSAIVITRPPEIIACLKIMTDSEPVFLIFDSHPRPKHPRGAGFIFNISHGATASYLSKLLAVDRQLLADRDTRWQAQLLGSFSADVFVPSEVVDPSNMPQIIMESSLSLLALKSQVAELKAQNGSITSLIQQLQHDNRNLKDNIKAVTTARQREQHQERGWWSFGSELFRPSEASSWSGPSHSNSQRSPRSSEGNSWYGPPWNSQRDFPSPPPGDHAGRHHESSYSPPPMFYSQVVQHGSLPHAGSSRSGQSQAPKNGESRPTQQQTAPPDHPQKPHSDTSSEPLGMDSSLALALQLQRQYEEEDRRLRRQMKELEKHKQVFFDCGICMEKLPIDDVARIERCKHAYCRDCLRQYILSQLAEQRFPIICAMCVADKETRSSGVVSQALIQTIGIPEKEYAKFEELQLLAFALQINCRKCKKTFLLDKHEFQAEQYITCPLPKCRHVWCKGCQQPVTTGGPQHSCDGTNELNHLMQSQGWKRCPGCQTPVQKISGCNNMTCTAPACGMYFCYACGGSKSLGRGSFRCRC